MTVRSYPHAAALAGEAFAQTFPHIGYTVRPVQAEQAVDLTWTDGPTPSQVHAILDPSVRIRTFRHISEDFRALLADDFEHITGEPYDPDRRYSASFENSTIVPSHDTLTTGDLLLRRLSQVGEVVRIRLAFSDDEGADGDMPTLISAVDEYTEDNWGRVPEFHKNELAKYRNVREVNVTVSDAAVLALFGVPNMRAQLEGES